MLGKAVIHYMNLLQGNSDARGCLIRRFNRFHHYNRFLGQESMVVVYVAAGIVIVAAALAGLLILP
ncbi:MAG: hypothetical protein GQ565_09675 [Candidatus Aegiribacteria sp.]|nr:hypothetical protein [Candidatus Aegiribacteria sp.]